MKAEAPQSRRHGELEGPEPSLGEKISGIFTLAVIAMWLVLLTIGACAGCLGY